MAGVGGLGGGGREGEEWEGGEWVGGEAGARGDTSGGHRDTGTQGHRE